MGSNMCGFPKTSALGLLYEAFNIFVVMMEVEC